MAPDITLVLLHVLAYGLAAACHYNCTARYRLHPTDHLHTHSTCDVSCNDGLESIPAELAFICMQVVLASQTAVLEIVPWLDHTQLHETLLPALDKLMLCPEHEIRSAVTQLYAHLGPALLSSSEGSAAQNADAIQGVLMQRVLDQAEDMDFQVRRV